MRYIYATLVAVIREANVKLDKLATGIVLSNVLSITF